MSFTNTPPCESDLFPVMQSGVGTSNGYTGIGLLHHGTYADTYRAQCGGKFVLVKAAHQDDPVCADILQREYDISSGLNHPNIAHVGSFEEIAGLGKSIVMEYVDGVSLTEYLATRATLKSKRKVLRQLIAAVGYLHEKGIVHNDLKPENILISSREGNVKLIDFGLSDDDAHYLLKTLGCTPAYASPELLAGNGQPDARSDIYSLGKIISVIFPGRYSAIVRKSTSSQRAKRYSNVEALGRAFKRRALLSWLLPFILAVLLAAVPVVSSLILEHIRVEETIRKEAEVTSKAAETERLTAAADSALEALTEQYEKRISSEPYRIFGLSDVSKYLEEYNQLRDTHVQHFDEGSERESFLMHLDSARDTALKKLYDITDTLPGMDGLSLEEIRFYTNLASSGKSYVKYAPN